MIWYVRISKNRKMHVWSKCPRGISAVSKCRKEVPSSYQSGIRNKAWSEASSSSSRIPSSSSKKKAVIISCPMSQRFLMTLKGSSRLIVLLLQWSEPMIHAARRIIVTCAALEHAEALYCPRPSPVLCLYRGPECRLSPPTVINELKSLELTGIQGFWACN